MAGIGTIVNTINNAMNTAVAKLPSLPSFLTLCISLNRTGMSSIDLTSNIISRLNSAGIPSGVNEDGSDNLTNKFARIIAEEVINMIKDHLSVDGCIKPGDLNFYGTGANSGGPVVVTGTNLLPIQMKGYAR